MDCNQRSTLYLVKGQYKDTGFWKIGYTPFQNPIDEDSSNFIECHRKELIGIEAAKEIIKAIEQNIDNLENEIFKDGLQITKPEKGISFDIPLTVLEEIYDFWVEKYYEKIYWKTSIGLLKMKKNMSLNQRAIKAGLMGHAGRIAPLIEKLHSYRPPSPLKNKINEPMWA
tara:strand:- start:630 stop:1139 length:510 start_codon:yes stop_codon:yes gene_type:complete